MGVIAGARIVGERYVRSQRRQNPEGRMPLMDHLREVPLLIIMLNLAGILTHQRFRRWRRLLIFGVFVIAGIANPSPDPITMLVLGGACAALVEVAEFIVWRNDRRRARRHPDPYAGLSDDEPAPLEPPLS